LREKQKVKRLTADEQGNPGVTTSCSGAVNDRRSARSGRRGGGLRAAGNFEKIGELGASGLVISSRNGNILC
jgi:hypothetical protein